MTKEKKDLHMYSQQQPNQVTKIAFSSLRYKCIHEISNNLR